MSLLTSYNAPSWTEKSWFDAAQAEHVSKR